VKNIIIMSLHNNNMIILVVICREGSDKPLSVQKQIGGESYATDWPGDFLPLHQIGFASYYNYNYFRSV